MKRAIAAFVVALMSCAVRANDGVDAIVTLRDTGYMLGDLLDERIDVKLPATFAIDRESLPLPGRVAPWLEVRHAELGARDASGTQSLVVTYQIFAEAENATPVPIPAFKLRLRGAGDARTIDVPARSFLLSPGLPAALADEDRELRPSAPPQLLPQAGMLGGALASLALAFACAAYLLWRYDRLPFLPHAPGPLLRTWRRWRRRDGRDMTLDDQSNLLRELHAALNASAGETLYPSTLSRLFECAPFLAPMRAPIEHWFATSWASFYGSSQGQPFDAREVLAMLHGAADRERGVPC